MAHDTTSLACGRQHLHRLMVARGQASQARKAGAHHTRAHTLTRIKGKLKDKGMRWRRHAGSPTETQLAGHGVLWRGGEGWEQEGYAIMHRVCIMTGQLGRANGQREPVWLGLLSY